jgi:hypothetical protein
LRGRIGRTGSFQAILLADGEGKDQFTVYPGDAYFTMNGRSVYEKATTAVPECIQEILRINGLGLEDVSMIVPHQATAGVLKRIAEVLNIPVFPDTDEPGVLREHRWSHSSAAPGPGKPTRSPPRRRSSLTRVHRRRLDLGRRLVSMVSSGPPSHRSEPVVGLPGWANAEAGRLYQESRGGPFDESPDSNESGGFRFCCCYPSAFELSPTVPSHRPL